MRDNRGSLIGQRTPNGNHWYYLKDGLGSIVAVIDGTGTQVKNRYGYDAYGNSIYKTETVTNPWGFAGGFLDPTQLVKFGARYYDPNVGRWTQCDGSSSAPANKYVYAGDDPVNGADPSGKCWLTDASIAGGYALQAGFFQWGSWLAVGIPDLLGELAGLQWITGPGTIVKDGPFESVSQYYAGRAAYSKQQAEYWWGLTSEPGNTC